MYLVLSVNGAKNRKFFLIIIAQQNLKQFTSYLAYYLLYFSGNQLKIEWLTHNGINGII
jgi:hypothetical protein